MPRGSPGHDQLGKVRPVIDNLSARFAELYDPHREVAVDEAMIKFTGRSTLNQYMPMKPIKRRIKVWVLGDSHNGYFHKFQVYTGKEGSGEKQLGQRVVKDLIQDLEGKNHHVFVNNFFTSEKFVHDVADNNIYACGTARKDRQGFSPSLKTAKPKNRPVTILCTCMYVYACVCVRVCVHVHNVCVYVSSLDLATCAVVGYPSTRVEFPLETVSRNKWAVLVISSYGCSPNYPSAPRACRPCISYTLGLLARERLRLRVDEPCHSPMDMPLEPEAEHVGR